MAAEYWKVDAVTPDAGAIAAAAAVLRAGGIVAFPTETVYGLGGDALNPAAVARVFAAKGRPNTNPVIVHVAEAGDVGRVAVWSGTAATLAAAFWPGPLTLVLPKRATVPDAVTAGGPTVGVRCPDHNVARALIRAAGTPLAAPSANRSTELSPTRAEHVRKSLGESIDFLLDGGPCPGGIESTVVDVTDGVRILRPGLITQAMLEAVVGPVRVGAVAGVAKSPGLMAKHYSPRTPLKLVPVGTAVGGPGLVVLTDMPADPAGYAAVLYDRLHGLDAGGHSLILVEEPPDHPDWAGVRDRLTRAAS